MKPENIPTVAGAIRADLHANEAESIIVFLDAMDWDASFAYFG